MRGDKKTNNMTAEILRIDVRKAEARSAASTDTAETSPDGSGGWDPYEVWRTRVLLPRQLDSQTDAAPEPLPSVNAGNVRLPKSG